MLGPRTRRENIHTLVRPRRALAKRGGVLGTSMGAVLPPWVPAPPLWAPTSLLWVLAPGTTTWVPTPPVTSMGSPLRPWAPAPTPPWSSDPLPLPLWVPTLGPTPRVLLLLPLWVLALGSLLVLPPPPWSPGGGGAVGEPQNLCGPCTGAPAAGEGVRERETRRYPHPPRAPWLPHRTRLKPSPPWGGAGGAGAPVLETGR